MEGVNSKLDLLFQSHITSNSTEMSLAQVEKEYSLLSSIVRFNDKIGLVLSMFGGYEFKFKRV